MDLGDDGCEGDEIGYDKDVDLVEGKRTGSGGRKEGDERGHVRCGAGVGKVHFCGDAD